jgi:NhaP-type Na+/H+ or K+/H+ antiporter
MFLSFHSSELLVMLLHLLAGVFARCLATRSYAAVWLCLLILVLGTHALVLVSSNLNYDCSSISSVHRRCCTFIAFLLD